MHPCGARHVLVHHVVDAARHVNDGQAGPFGERLHGALRRIAVDCHAAARKEFGIQETQQQVGVRDGRRFAATAVADRSGLRSGTFRPDFQQLHVVDMGNAAAAGADFDELDGRDVQWQAAALGEALFAGRLEMIVDMGFAIVDQGQLRRRAAHIECENIVDAGAAAEIGGDERSRGGAGFEQLHGRPLGFGDMGEAAIREHHEIGRADPERRGLFHQPVDVNIRQRFHIGVRYRRRGPVVLADFRRHIVRCRNDQVRIVRGDGVERGIFVRGIGVGVQKHDRDRLGAVGEQGIDLPQQFRFVERNDFASVGPDTLADFQAQIPWRQRLRHGDMDIVQLVFALTADLQHIAETLGRNEAGARALALDQGVRKERRRVHDPVQRVRRDAAFEQLR